MKNKIKILLLFTFLLPSVFSAPNHNTDIDKWLYVVSTDAYNFYYDVTSLNSVTPASSVSVWVKAVPRTKQEWGGKEINYVIKQWVFYSGSRQFQEAQTIFYFEKNSEQYFGTEKKTVKPGTVAEKFYDKFCSN